MLAGVEGWGAVGVKTQRTGSRTYITLALGIGHEQLRVVQDLSSMSALLRVGVRLVPRRERAKNDTG